MRMAVMYFSCGEKEKGLALFAWLEFTGPAGIMNLFPAFANSIGA